jgi:hypothetical protein
MPARWLLDFFHQASAKAHCAEIETIMRRGAPLTYKAYAEQPSDHLSLRLSLQFALRSQMAEEVFLPLETKAEC